MEEDLLTIKTGDGAIDCYRFAPKPDGDYDAIIFFMDGLGIRPELKSMAMRLAMLGYVVLLPNLYYRHGEIAPLNVAEAFDDGPENERMMTLVGSLTRDMVAEDTRCLLEALDADHQTRNGETGCIGYCMGGGFALTAAGRYPDRIAAAASIHGAFLATDQEDSPHLLAAKMTAKIYVAIAGIDPWFTDQEAKRLKTSLDAASLDHAVETSEGVVHGFAIGDTPSYDETAAERHWDKISSFFKAGFGR